MDWAIQDRMRWFYKPQICALADFDHQNARRCFLIRFCCLIWLRTKWVAITRRLLIGLNSQRLTLF